MLAVHPERWTLERLTALEPGHERDGPKFFPPIVVLYWYDRYFLIDGNTRINVWPREQDNGPHFVFVISAREEGIQT